MHDHVPITVLMANVERWWENARYRSPYEPSNQVRPAQQSTKKRASYEERLRAHFIKKKG